MSYTIYKTAGVILKKRNVGEADKAFSFFTEDFGRVEVVSQGVRYLKSKLRYSLSGISFLRLGFVPTSSGSWRLIDAEETEPLRKIKTDSERLKTAKRLIFLVERFVQGEEHDANLWNKIKGMLMFLENGDFSDESLEDFEVMVSLDFLAHLGYADRSIFSENTAAVEDRASRRSFLVALIKKALEESQL